MKPTIILTVIFFIASCRQAVSIPPVTGGVLDLSKETEQDTGIIPLDGEWEFYYGELLEPEEFSGNGNRSKKTYIKIPSKWDDFGYSNFGVATYRLKIILKDINEGYALKIPAILSSYRLFINGKPVSGAGLVDKNPDEYEPQHKPAILHFTASTPEVEILIHVANFSDNIGGIRETIYFGKSAYITKFAFLSLSRDLILFGIIFIAGIYHLFYFLFNKDFSFFYFSLFNFLIAIRTAIVGEKFLLRLFPEIPWIFHIKLEFFTLYLSLPVFAFFIANQFPLPPQRFFFLHLNHKKIVHVFFYVSLLFALVSLMFPVSMQLYPLQIYQIIMILFSLYLLGYIFYATLKKQEGAIYSLLGVIALLLSFINDLLYSKNIISTGYIIAYGVVIFILMQSLSISNKLSILYRRNVDLAKELKNLLEAFEKFVPKQFLTSLHKNDITQVRLGDHIQREITILFVDIRSFTKISESLSPEQNFHLINTYLGEVEPVIHKHNGFIDKYLGDGIMALFVHDSYDAVLASIEIQKKLQRFSFPGEDNTGIKIQAGCGIHSGVVMLGVIGSAMRMETTVISDTVNTSHRLEKLNRDLGTDILVSENVIKQIPDGARIASRYIGTVLLKGKRTPVKVYEIYEHYPEDKKRMYEETRETFQKALQLFSSQEFEKALYMFEEILKYHPQDQPANFYRAKCKKELSLRRISS